MELVLGLALAGLVAICAAGGLWQRARRSGAGRPTGRRVAVIVLALLGGYILVLVAVFFLQPLFDR